MLEKFWSETLSSQAILHKCSSLHFVKLMCAEKRQGRTIESINMCRLRFQCSTWPLDIKRTIKTFCHSTLNRLLFLFSDPDNRLTYINSILFNFILCLFQLQKQWWKSFGEFCTFLMPVCNCWVSLSYKTITKAIQVRHDLRFFSYIADKGFKIHPQSFTPFFLFPPSFNLPTLEWIASEHL